MLARPWPMNSWLASMRCPDLRAIARPIEMASVSESTVTPKAMPISDLNASALSSGAESDGSAPGSAPSVWMPVHSSGSQSSSTQASTAPAASATIM